MSENTDRFGTEVSGGVGQDTVAGIVLVALAAFAWWQTWHLDSGSLASMGPGLMPKALATLVGVAGLALVVTSMLDPGERAERFTFRGPFFILGSVVLFGLTIRGMDETITLPLVGSTVKLWMPALGLAAAGPLAIIFAGFADEETRFGETIAFGVVMTALCILLFKYALALPIPVAPWLLDY